MIFDEIVGGASAYRRIYGSSPRKRAQRVQKIPSTLKFARKVSPVHQRDAVQ